MDAEQLTRGQLESEFSALARTMCFSKSTIASFAKEATRGQLVAVCDLIRDENATREENKKARLLRQARFLSLKSFSDVSARAASSQPTGAWPDPPFCRQGIWAF